MRQDLQIAIGFRNLARALAGGQADTRPETVIEGARRTNRSAIFVITPAPVDAERGRRGVRRSLPVAPRDAEPRLSGYRALQPEWIATSEDEERRAWRIPLPRPTTPNKQRVSVNGSIQVIEWTEDDLDAEAREGGAYIDVAARIRQIEEMRVRGTARGWERVRAEFERTLPGGYEPRTEVLKQHARELPPVLAGIARSPKTVLAREERIVPPERVEHTSRRSVKWLAGRPGRTMEERAKRGVLTEVRVTDPDTRENRVVRDFAEMTAREIQRLPQGLRDMHLVQWGRECANVAAALRERGVGKLEPGAKSNQVLRMNPGYRRIWTAREELIRKTDLEDDLWAWQAEGWNELGLLVASASVMNLKGWAPVLKPPVALRVGQEKGRWLALEQEPFCVLIEPDTGWWMEVHAGGRNPGSEVPPGACCALTLGTTRQGAGKKAKLTLYSLGPMEGEIRHIDRMEALADRKEREAIPYDVGVLTAQERMPKENPLVRTTGGKRHECRVFAVRMKPGNSLEAIMGAIQRAIRHLQAEAGKQ